MSTMMESSKEEYSEGILSDIFSLEGILSDIFLLSVKDEISIDFLEELFLEELFLEELFRDSEYFFLISCNFLVFLFLQ